MVKGLFFITALCILQSCHSCKEFAEQFKANSCHFVVKEKSRQFRMILIKGVNIDGKYEEYRTTGDYKIYDAAEPGDTILKILGEAKISLIKKDTTIVTKWICNE
ncbi:hypothetical protein [Chitinophaga silvatica]|nr:hypothetical protein [Chitinophaga silvatica]